MFLFHSLVDAVFDNDEMVVQDHRGNDKSGISVGAPFYPWKSRAVHAI